MSARALRWAHLLLVAGWVAASIAAYPRLPARIPQHFGFTGPADTWVTTSLGAWLLLPALGGAVFLSVHLLSRAARRTPEMWSLSPADAKPVRSLSADQVAELAEAVDRSTARALILATVALMGLQLGTYAAAVEGTGRIPWYANAILWGSVAALLALAVRDQSRLRRQISHRDTEARR